MGTPENESPPETPAPGGDERLAALDLVRGVAILAILVANIPSFSGPEDGPLGPHAPDLPWWDRAVVAATLFLVDGKFITLFSILFGAGLALQADRARAAGRSFDAYYVRRQLLLLALGLAHGLLLWYGDILSAYAVLGLIVLVLSRRSQQQLLTCAATCLGIAGVGTLATACALAAAEGMNPASRPPGEELPPQAAAAVGTLTAFLNPENQVHIYRDGTFGEMVLHRALMMAGIAAGLAVQSGWYLLACFLFGVVLKRHGVFHDVDAHRRLLRGFVAFGLGIGVPLHAAAVVLYLFWPKEGLHETFHALGVPAQALGYLGLLLLWSRTGWAEWLQLRLRAVGRMALTNYLMQSVLCGFVFYSYGLRLYGELGRAQALVVVGLVWALQLLASPWWLHFFQAGPVEWAWRSLAEGRARPLLRRA